MDTRERRRQKPEDPTGIGPEAPGGEGVASSRRELDRMMRAGDSAIDAVLSRDSQSFLDNSRQQGGQ